MGFQSAVNETIGTASGVIGKVDSARKEALKQKKKTASFSNFNKNTANRAREAIKSEREGKKAQLDRIKKRKKAVKLVISPETLIHRDID